MAKVAVSSAASGASSGLERPTFARERSVNNHPPAAPEGWLVLREYALQEGISPARARLLVATGQVVGMKVQHRGRAWWLVRAKPVDLATAA
jgi:hypothetical protein